MSHPWANLYAFTMGWDQLYECDVGEKIPEDWCVYNYGAQFYITVMCYCMQFDFLPQSYV